MRNLKKVLALGLAMVMAFGLMISAAAFTDDATIVNGDAAQLLTELKVISGFPDGSFKPEGNVTRAQIAKMIYVAMRKGVDDLGANFVNASVPLTDIGSHWAKGYIKYAYGANIVAGFPNGTFQPDANVTGYQAAKMMLTALGYSSTVEQYAGTGWDFRVAVDAASAGLLEGLEAVDLSKPLTRDNAAQMIYNGIFANMVTYDEDGVLTEGKTFAEAKLGLLEINGILQATDEASVIAGGVADEDEYTLLVDADFVEGSTAVAYDIPGNADISLLGQEVTAFVKVKTDADTEELIEKDFVKTYGKVVASTGKNNVFVEYSDDFDPDDDYETDANTLYSYDYATAATNLSPTLPKYGDKTTFVDNDDDAVFEYVITVAQVYGEATVKTAAKTIKVTNLITSATDIEDIKGADAIANGDKVIGYHIASTDAPYEYAVAKAPSFSGKLTGITGDDELKIDGKKYELSAITGVDTTLNEARDNINKTLTFYTDGKFIVDIDTDSEGTPDKYCGVRDVSWASGSGAFADAGQVAVTLEDGTEHIYDVDSVGDDIVALNFDISDTADSGTANNEEYFIGNVFSYSMEGDDIVLEEKVTDTLVSVGADYDAGAATLRANNKSYSINATTLFFDWDDADDEFDVFVGRTNSPELTMADDVYVYRDDTDTSIATVVLSTGAQGGSNDDNYGIVLEYASTENSDGDSYYEITMFDGKTVKTINSDPDGIKAVGGGSVLNTWKTSGTLVQFTLSGEKLTEISAIDINDSYDDADGAYSGYAYDYEADGAITLRRGHAANDAGDYSFNMASDAVVVDLVDLGGEFDLDNVDPVTDEDDIADAAATDANVIIRVDDGEVVAVYYFSDETITVA